MLEKFNGLKGGIALLGTSLTYLFGGWDMALQLLVLVIVIDYVSGVLKGFYTKEVSSNTGFKGIIRKAMIFVVVIVAVVLDRLIGKEGVWLFRTLVVYFFISNECISILENCSVMGLPIPKKLLDVLAQIKDKTDNGEDVIGKGGM